MITGTVFFFFMLIFYSVILLRKLVDQRVLYFDLIINLLPKKKNFGIP